MIASLQGKVQSIGEDELVVEVGGVGLRVSVPLARLAKAPRVGESLFLFTHLVVREDSLDLYGFADAEGRRLFDMLMSVNGVGPRLALATLAHMAPEVIRRSIARDQPEVLTKVPGIGRKTGEKIVFDLKDKLGEAGFEAEPPSELDSEVVSVLTGLGYNLVEAQSAVQSIPDEAPETIEERVRLALRYFASP